MARHLGLGTILRVDADANSTYETITLVLSAKPPGREREEVDDTTLDSTLQTNSMGIEKHSHYTFRIKDDGTDAVVVSLNTLFGSRAKVNWRIVWTYATSNTWTFEGVVQKLDYQTIEHNKHYELEVTVHRTGGITIT